MPDLLKDFYNQSAIRELALDIQSVYPEFEVDEFVKATMGENWKELELKERIYQISTNLGKFLPEDYVAAIGIIDQIVMNYGSWLEGTGWYFPIFVEIYGQDEKHWDTSMAALERYTPYASSELAVRPFIINHDERMMAQMVEWSKSENELVRRLSCEGCRPQLPWAPALPSFKKDATPILPILERLKTDSSLHVRKSVANNLNDISKTQPELVIKLAKEWYGQNEDTDWIVKHGCRTLLKKGNREVLEIFGHGDDDSVEVSNFALERTAIAIGEDLIFSFTISRKDKEGDTANSTTKVRLEYAIDYVKANGKRSRKIFKISETNLKANEEKLYTRKQSFADKSTRKHYPGTHVVTLIVNGVEQGSLEFELV